MSHWRALTVLAGLAASGASVASVLVVQGDTPLQNTNFSAFINVAQFDPSLGTLDSINVVANVGYAGRHYGENMSSTASATYLSRLTYTISLTGPGLVAAVSAANVNEVNGALAIADGSFDFGGPAGYTFNFTDGANGLANLNGAADLGLFTGLGTVQYSVSAIATAFRQASGGVVTQGTTSQAFADVTVTYNYTAIPAPGAAAGMLAGLALVTRRRR